VVFVERRAARLALTLFLFVAVVCTAQVGWWIVYQIGESKKIAQLEWGVLGTAREAVRLQLSEQYRQVWSQIDSLRRVEDWNGALPRPLLDHPAVQKVSRTQPVRKVYASKLGPASADSWTWRVKLAQDSLYVVLDAQFPEVFLKRSGSSFDFSGVAPAPGWDPWPGVQSPLAVRDGEAQRIEKDRRRGVIMFASEGSFFVILIILGAYLIYRSVRQSADLRRRQQNFIAAVTHELKAPLASVKLYAETLERPNLEREQQMRYLGRMLEDVARLENLIDNILVAGRMESKGFHIKPRKSNFSRDLEEYVDAMRGFLERNNFELRTRIEPDLAAQTDYDAMRRVVDGIVENAVKYSGERKEADLSLAGDGDRIVLTVRDYGAGVPPEETERVFDAFYRVGDEMTRRIKGTGLGLYLVREIVAAHGGQVKLESGGNGSGTTVTVTLKKAQA
jgi:signal transduction histidine kinase